MLRAQRYVIALLAIVLIAFVGSADAQGKGKGKGKEPEQAKEQGKGKDQEKTKEQGKGKEQGQGQGKVKQSHLSGKQLVGDKIKVNGNHVIHQNGKHTVSVNVKEGKIAGVNVKHSEKGDVPVKKYKYRTTKKMATGTGEAKGISFASYHGMLPQIQDMGTVYIGYAYIDDYGNEVIYWFPYEMIYDGDAGAVEYVPLD
jgi:hypothetical protein